MKSIIRFAVKYPVTIIMITLGLCMLGVISYGKLGTDLFPNLKTPSLYVSLNADDLPPEEIENSYIKNLESTMARMPGVKNVESATSVGKSYIKVEYSWGTDMDDAFLDLQRSVSSISRNEGITSIDVSKYDINSKPIMQIAVTHDSIKDINLIRGGIENYMRNELIRLEGVADIRLDGQEYSFVEINLNQYLMDSYGVGVQEVSSAIQSKNKNISGGSIVHKNLRYTIKGISKVDNISQLGDIIVKFNENTETKTQIPVYIKNIADIKIINTEPYNISKINGERCVSMSIYKESNSNTVDAADKVIEKIKEFEKAMSGYRFSIVDNQAKFISSSVGELESSALIGIFLAIFVIYLFLRMWTNTFIVSISIPISIIITFNLMYFNGLSINIMTLGGLALGAGMLVDNAIVVMENIYRHFEKGKNAIDASIEGAAEVVAPIISSTITTIVVFLPIVYIEGAAGELFKEQAWTVSFSLLSSVFVAVLLIPMLASKLLNSKKIKQKSLKFGAYTGVLRNILKRPIRILILSVLLIVGGYFMIPIIGTEFMPDSEENGITAKITLPEGSILSSTNNATSSVEYRIKELCGNDLDMVYSHIGPYYEGDNKASDNNSEVTIKLKKNSKISYSEIIDDFRVPDNSEVNIAFSKKTSTLESVLGISEYPIVIEVRGEENDEIELIAKDISHRIGKIKGLNGINTSMEGGNPQLNIKIDRLKSGVFGIDITTITSQLKEKLNNKKAGNFDFKGESIDIELKQEELDAEEIASANIVKGESVYRLDELSDISLSYSPRTIYRTNQIRVGKVYANIDKGVNLNDVVPAIKDEVEKISMPQRYSYKITGEEEKRSESFAGLNFAMTLSVILVYMVMASQFESLRHPFIIMISIPIAVVGSILAFLIFGYTLNMMAFIGIIMLVGIAVNNSILLIDAINKERLEENNLKEAIIKAAQKRIRPILMTSTTTILALLPMCFGLGEGSSLRSPMAVAVISGLITSTLLTLVVIPSLYYLFEPKKNNR